MPLFGRSCLLCCLGGGFCRLLWCWWAVWWLWAVVAPPPPVYFSGGDLPVPPSAFPGLGWGGAGPSVVVCPSWVWVLVPAVVSLFSAPRSPFLLLPGPWVVSCSHVVSLPVPCPYWRPPVTLSPSVPACQSVPLCPLPSPCPWPFPSRCHGGGEGGGRRWPRPGDGWPGAIGGGSGGCRGGGGPRRRPGGGPLIRPAA